MVAWAAGFVDGEGCIALNRYRNRYSTAPTRPWVYTLKLDVAQKVTDPLERLVTLFGGRLYREEVSRSRPRSIWHWVAQATVAEKALREMLPHLTVKREQAEVALSFQQRSSALSGCGKTRRSEKDVHQDQRDYERLRALKVSEP